MGGKFIQKEGRDEFSIVGDLMLSSSLRSITCSFALCFISADQKKQEVNRITEV